MRHSSTPQCNAVLLAHLDLTAQLLPLTHTLPKLEQSFRCPFVRTLLFIAYSSLVATLHVQLGIIINW